MNQHKYDRRTSSLFTEVLTLLVATGGAITLVALLSFTAPTIDPFGRFLPAPHLATYVRDVDNYLIGLLRGDFGKTYRGHPVAPTLLAAMQRSALLMGTSVLVAVPVGLAWGTILAHVRRAFSAALLFGLNTLLMSLPSFVVLLFAIEAVATFTVRTGIQLTYTYGYGVDRHLILPTFVLALRGATYLARAMQVAQEDILQQDWIRVARAKGFGGWQLWRRQVFPALLLPLIGGILGMLRIMVGGLVIIEYIYQWRGIGDTMLSIGKAGLRPTEGAVAAGAAGTLVLFFIITDSLGRLTVHAITRQRGR